MISSAAMGWRRGSLGVISLICLLGGWTGLARATEVHTLFDGRCRRTSGVLVHVSAETVALVDLSGKLAVRSRDEIAGIAIHKTLENPLAEIFVTEGLRYYLKDVWVGDDAEPTFTGWTTAFFDDLFLYFDLEGQTHVLDPEEIRRIRPSELRQAQVQPHTHAAVVLAFPPEVVPCGVGAVPPDAVLPSRVIADRIKVGDYLGKLEQRYLDQEGFEERTYVYAEPFLFDLASRLGLLYDPEWRIPFPLYFRWSNGRPYRFQSLSVVGNASHEWLPSVAPSMSVRSDVKSHFFNATFIGHLLSLPAGTDAFLLAEEPVVEAGEAPRVEHSYNYVLLMGADWWRLSASAGVSYLATRITAPLAQPRSILATGVSPTLRLRYQSPALQLRALWFRTRASGPLSDVLDVDPEDLMGEADYHWRLDTVRLGATWRPFETVEVQLDQLASRGVYGDTYSMTAVGLALWELATSGEVAVSFGRYVTVRGNARLYLKRYDLHLPTAREDSNLESRFGGALEFVF